MSSGYDNEDPTLSQVYSSTAFDPIDGAYGPQALSYCASEDAEHSTVFDAATAEVDMLQSSGLGAFADGGQPPAAAVPPRSYSYTAPGEVQVQVQQQQPHAVAQAPVTPGGNPSMDAFARLRAGNISITPGAAVGPAAAAARFAATRTASSPVVPTFRNPYSPVRAPPTWSAQLPQQAVVESTHEPPYPAYSVNNPVYDLYGSSYAALNAPSPEAHPQLVGAHGHDMRQPQAATLSQNPTAPADPFDPKALGLPMPPPRLNGGATTSNSYSNIYSSSGFDLVGILARVVNRRKPTIEIGAVDMSCSFVVVDAKKFDQPVVYASETFLRLTGYNNEEVVGRNCRFLQAPGDQEVVQGEKRKYTDGNAAHHLRTHIVSGQETQVSLINYHKKGKPFINLVTCVPISWHDSGEIDFFVGFQVDLVDQPAAILDKMQNGSYIVNYSVVHATIARNPSVISFDPTGAIEQLEDSAQHAAQQAQAHAASAVVKAAGAAQQARALIRTDEPGELLDSVARGGLGALANDTMRKQFSRLLVDQCDDLVHVLSLKGALLYVSAASRQLLEYEPHELLGKTLSSFCHPSDIVSVQRELKDAGVSAHPTVSLVYRIRRKNSGYVWFEAQGRLHLEPGKGRKCVILSGRPREVYKMSWRDLELAGGVGSGEHEFWAKVCVDGIFLSVTQSAEKVLGVGSVQRDVLGKSVGDMSRRATDDSQRFMDALVEASRGTPTVVQHMLIPIPGKPAVEVVTRFYPARSGTDPHPNQPPNESHLAPIGGKQVSVIAQVSLASNESERARRASTSAAAGTAASSVATGASPSVAGTSSGFSGAHTADSTNATSAAVTAATSASATSAGVAAHAPLVAAAVPSTGPPGLTSFSTVPSTFKALAAPSSVSDNVFDELNVTRGTSWQFELHQMRLTNKKLREERSALEALKKKKAVLQAQQPAAQKAGPSQRACANCGRTSSAEWRSGPTGPKTLCNACGLRWSKAKSQAAAAEKKRKEAEEREKAAAAAAAAAAVAQGGASSSSASQSRSGSRDSSGSGASTDPTTAMPTPSPLGTYQICGTSPHSASVPHPQAGYSLPNSAASSPLPMYQSMSIGSPLHHSGSAVRPPLVHQPSSLQYSYGPTPQPPMVVHAPYSGAEGPGPPTA
ncbi:uncharacterized protein JCM10292_000797 [Rhodotorula paludigena]|uniref:uncharacterized protein n=1 Tax=Rhodotorula paludigena TaxID=86838 RepID=UPI00316DE9BB